MTKHRCAICDGRILLTQSEAKNRLSKSKSGKIFCSRDCSAKYLSTLYENVGVRRKAANDNESSE